MALMDAVADNVRSHSVMTDVLASFCFRKTCVGKYVNEVRILIQEEG
jgi:hypothetical protein